MLTQGQQMVVDVNDTVVIGCQFQETTDDRFNLFDNPVHWRKSQLDEHSQINMMVNLVEPFSQVDQGRLRVSFAGSSPNYTMTLVIARRSNTESFQSQSSLSVSVLFSRPTLLPLVVRFFLCTSLTLRTCWRLRRLRFAYEFWHCILAPQVLWDEPLKLLTCIYKYSSLPNMSQSLVEFRLLTSVCQT